MRNFKPTSLSLVLACATLLGACFDGNNGDSGGESDGAATEPGTTAPGTTTANPTTTEPGATEPGTTTPDPSTTNTTTDPTDGGGAFVFDTTPPGDMVQLDRMGMPAVATAVISKEFKDAYNSATPVDDAAAEFVADITASVTALHVALDDDLAGFGFTPCAAMDCVAQAAPLVVPDTLQITPGMPAGFPNGRRLEDPVVDITLAVVLLDLDAHPVTTLADLPLNPAKNDKEFLPAFPYVALPH